MNDTHTPPPVAPAAPGQARSAIRTEAQQAARFARRFPAAAAAAARICAQLDEPNRVAVARLAALFGPALAEAKAAEAATLAAQLARGETPDAPAALWRTTAGMPRTPGGMFFALMRTHAIALGLNFAALPLPVLGPPAQRPALAAGPTPPAPTPRAPSARPAEVLAPAAAESGAALPIGRASRPPTTSPLPMENSSVAKPTRVKATVIGPLLKPAAPDPGGQPGLLQLLFRAEMSPTLPKGQPNLGVSRVVVLCTEKQYQAVAAELTPTSRLLAEGEPVPRVVEGKPVLVVVCTRLTTVEREQARQGKAPPAS